jgi:hypothetical protein
MPLQPFDIVIMALPPSEDIIVMDLPPSEDMALPPSEDMALPPSNDIIMALPPLDDIMPGIADPIPPTPCPCPKVSLLSVMGTVMESDADMERYPTARSDWKTNLGSPCCRSRQTVGGKHCWGEWFVEKCFQNEERANHCW